MRVFVKAVITGFGLSVGKMLYEKVSERFGANKSDKANGDEPDPVVGDDDSDDLVSEPE